VDGAYSEVGSVGRLVIRTQVEVLPTEIASRTHGRYSVDRHHMERWVGLGSDLRELVLGGRWAKPC
jgi:hypothetical protein